MPEDEKPSLLKPTAPNITTNTQTTLTGDHSADIVEQSQTLPAPEQKPAKAPKAQTQSTAEPLPTKGRTVMYHCVVNDQVMDLAAVVVKVWSDNCVNLKVFGEYGDDFSATSVTKAGTYGAAYGWSYPNRV